MNAHDQMVGYYRSRAPVYDDVYRYPERQNDLRYLEARIPALLAGRQVLEVAAGTGYWTRVISQSASGLTATDQEPAQLVQLRSRVLDCEVEVVEADAYSLDGRFAEWGFDGAFAGLWLSHVPRERMQTFFDSLHRCLAPGARIVLLDNSLTQCNRLPITDKDDLGNTYQDRELDGQIYRVLKNFPSADELRAWSGATRGDYQLLEHYWLYQYTLPGSGGREHAGSST